MRFLLAALAAFALSACAHDEVVSDSQAELMNAGAEIARTHCADCHAIGQLGESPLEAAPRFRLLRARYRFEVLEDELRSGVHVGSDSRMPRFQLTVAEVDALSAYLRSIQPGGD